MKLKNWKKRGLAIALALALMPGQSAFARAAGEHSAVEETDGWDLISAQTGETDGWEEIPAQAEEAGGWEEISAQTGETDGWGEVPAHAEETTDQTDDKPLPEGIVGMPDSYALTDNELEIKTELAENGVVDALQELTPGEDYARDEVVCLAEDAEHAELIAEAYGGELADYGYGVAVISLAGTPLEVEEAVAVGADIDNDIPAVEPNYYLELDDAPSFEEEEFDPAAEAAFSEENAVLDAVTFDDPFLSSSSNQYQWHHEVIGTPAAWQVTTGSDAVTVAVIDSGARRTHTEFVGKTGGRVFGGTLSGNDIVEAADDQGHGTHVTGIIAAAAGNGKGGAGIAPGVNILSIKVTNGSSIPISNLIKALYYIAGTGEDGTVTSPPRADIASMSLSTPSASAAFQAAVSTAYAAGITLCSSMGNTGNDKDSEGRSLANQLRYPAAFDEVIAVAAVDKNGARAYYSTWGEWADIAAPGSSIWSTYNSSDSGYSSKSGTSQATPIVSGICALYMSVMGHVSPQVMRAVLKEHATPVDPSLGIGVGIVDASFIGTLPAPYITLTHEGEVLGSTAEAGTVTIPGEVPPSSQIAIEQASLEGTLYYTTDGTEPAATGGTVTAGIRYTGPLEAASLLADKGTGETVTIRAAALNSVGVFGEISSLTCRIAPVRVSVVAPTFLLAGRSVTLAASVSVGSDRVSWEILSRDGLSRATLGASTGVLKTAAGETGTLTIKCTSADTGVFSTVTITVGKTAPTEPVSVIALSTGAETLHYSGRGTEDANIAAGKGWAAVSVTRLTGSSGADLLSSVSAGDISVVWTSSNPRVAVVKPVDRGERAVITAAGKGTATVTCTPQDGSGKKATVRITVKQDVEQIGVTGQLYIARGMAADYKASSVLPKKANVRKVLWSVDGGKPGTDGRTFLSDDGHISVDRTNGRVTVTAGATTGKEYTVTATAQDGSGITGSAVFTVVESKAARLGIDALTNATVTSNNKTTFIQVSDIPSYQAKYKAGAAPVLLTSLSLFTVDIPSTSYDERKLHLVATLDNDTLPLWTSGNTAVVTVTQTGDLCAVGKGTAVVTCAARDGSGKKARIRVKVAVPVSSVTISSKNGQNALGYGKTTAFAATVGEDYGKPGSRKLVWDYKVGLYSYTSGNVKYYDTESGNLTYKKSTYFTMSAGKFTVKKEARDVLSDKDICIFIYATSADGAAKATMSFKYLVVPVGKLYLFNSEKSREAFLTDSQYETIGQSIEVPYDNIRIYAGALYPLTGERGLLRTGVKGIVTSSSEQVATASWVDDGNCIDVRRVAAGTATITVTPSDGSGAKAQVKLIFR